MLKPSDSANAKVIQQSHGVGWNILAYTPSRFIEPLLALATLPILTRILGVAQYGDFQTIVLSATMVRILLFDWVNNCALRFYMPMKSDLDAYRANLLAALLLGAVASLPLLLLALVLLPGGGASGALLGGVLTVVIADGFARNQEMMLRAMQRPAAFTMLRVGLSLSRHGLGLVCLLAFSKSFAAYFGGWAAGTIALCVWACALTEALRGAQWSHLHRHLLAEFARFGFPVGVVLLAAAAQATGMRYVLQFLAGSEATGLFSAAYNIGTAPLSVFQSVMMLGLYPMAINAFEQVGRIDSVVHDGLRYFAMLAVPVGTLLVLLSEPFMIVLAGAEFGGASHALLILAVGSFVIGVSQYFLLGFLIAKQTGRWATIQVLTAAAGLGLAAMLVPRLGVEGAAIGTVLGQILTLAGSLFFGVRIGWAAVPGRTFAYSALSCVPMVVLSWAARHWLRVGPFEMFLVVTLLGSALFVGLLLASGELRRECTAVRFLIGARSRTPHRT